MFIVIPSELEAALIDRSLPPWELDGSFLAQATLEEYRTELTATPRFEETAATLRHALTGEGGGYAVLRLGNLAKALGVDDDRFLRLVTGFAAEVGFPSRPSRAGLCGRTSGSRSTRTPASPAVSGTTRSTWTW